MILHAFVEGVLTGMAKGGMTEVMRQGDRLNQILVQAEVARHGAPDLGNFDAVGQAGAETGLLRD
jgi:hypothetical protein